MDNSGKKGNRARRCPQEVAELCRQSISAVFLTRERKTLQQTLENAILKVQRENQLRPVDMALPLPGRRLIKRLIDEIPAFDRYSARYGHQAALKCFRSVTGHAAAQVPLERAEIDHTILDLFVVDDSNSLPLGRPYVTACNDDYTRCVLGLYVGFVPPSYLSVAKCLRDAFLPKTWLKEQYPDIKCDWPAYGVMRELVLDNGVEFHSESLEQVCLSLGIEMHYSPRKEPWFKGKIERFFRTLNEGVAHGTPGTSFSDIFERDDYDPGKHAVVTLSTCKKVIRLWVADVYHQKTHRALGTSPAQLWKSGIKPEDIPLPDDPSELDVIMGQAYRRILTHKGIELDGLFYNSPELTELRCRHGCKLEVEVRVDESDIGHIYVLAPTTPHIFKVPALRADYANCTSHWQHKVFRRYQARHSDINNGPDGWLAAKEMISQLIEADTHIKGKRMRKRIARYLDSCEPSAEQTPTNARNGEEDSETQSLPAIPNSCEDRIRKAPTGTANATSVRRKRLAVTIQTRVTDA
jgi:putative transposase